MKQKTVASSRKKPSKTRTKAVTPISKDEFVTKLFSKTDKSKILESIDKVWKRDLLICQELLNCSRDNHYKISSKVKLTTLSIQNIQTIVKNTDNHSLLIACLHLVFDEKSFLYIYEKMNKLGLLDDLYHFLYQHRKVSNVNTYLYAILLSDTYNETTAESFKFALFTLTLNLINNDSLLLEQMKKDRTSKIVGNLKPVEMQKLIDVFIYGGALSISELILSQNVETVSIEFVRNLRAKLSSLLIIEILKSENISRSTKHLSLFIEPRLKEIISNAQSLESILPLLLVGPQLKNFGLFDLITEKTKELLGKKEELAILLEDPFLRDIEFKNDQLSQLVDKQKVDLLDFENELRSSKVQIEKLKKMINVSEERNMGEARNEIDTRAQRDRQIRVDIYKDLIKVFEKDLNASNIILEDFGLEQLGIVSEKFTWDQEICESITRETLTEGLVVKPGYIWWDGNSKVVIRRVLLKAL